MLNQRENEGMAKIMAYSFDKVREKLLKEGVVSPDRIDEAIEEFRKYLTLIALNHRGLGMESPVVDEVWHTFILFTRDYAAFCEDVFGFFVHHNPSTSFTPISPGAVRSFHIAYEEVFGGPAPRIWGPELKCYEEPQCEVGSCEDAPVPTCADGE
ncbi:MAG: hypothetical protein WED08_02695 [Patescibacteria group bacterium]